MASKDKGEEDYSQHKNDQEDAEEDRPYDAVIEHAPVETQAGVEGLYQVGGSEDKCSENTGGGKAMIGLTMKELIKAYEIVEAENPAGGRQVQRNQALNYLRELLTDDLLRKEKMFARTKP